MDIWDLGLKLPQYGHIVNNKVSLLESSKSSSLTATQASVPVDVIGSLSWGCRSGLSVKGVQWALGRVWGLE